MHVILGNTNAIGQADSELLGFSIFFFSLGCVHISTAQGCKAEFHAWATSQSIGKKLITPMYQLAFLQHLICLNPNETPVKMSTTKCFATTSLASSVRHQAFHLQ